MMNRNALFFSLLLMAGWLQAQPRFRAGIIAGVSASQINGDNSAGYNKPGLIAGFRALSRLGDRSGASMELLFAQRGSQKQVIKDNFDPNFFALTLNYIEIPLQWHYYDWLVEGDNASSDYYRISFNAGFSYARFFSYRFRGEPNAIETVAKSYLNKNDVSLLLGFNFFFTRNLGITFRYVRSLGAIYNPKDFQSPPLKDALIGHCLYLQGVYLF